MAINVTIKDTQKFLTNLTEKSMNKIAKQSINRTLQGTKTFANKQIRRHRKLKASEINNEYSSTVKAKESHYSRMVARLVYSFKPISLIRFSKTKHQSQKGVKVKSRRPVIWTIKPGQRTVSKKFFHVKIPTLHIARNIGGTASTGNPAIAKGVVGSLSTLVKGSNIKRAIDRYTAWRLEREFRSNTAREIKKIITKK